MSAAEQSLDGLLCRVVGELVGQGIPLQAAKKEFERQYLLAALREHEGNLTRAARALGVHRNTLRNKVGSLEIAPEEYLPSSRSRRSRRRR